MPSDHGRSWVPFRPTDADLTAIGADVNEIPRIQQTLVDRCSHLRCPDRVAHQYQIAGSQVLFEVTPHLPQILEGVGLFTSGATHRGIGRISTGLGTPHVEAEPDFLGLMLAFQTTDGHRVDFLAINHPAAPTDDHRDFMSVLHATGESAGARVPFVGEWGDRDVGNFFAQQVMFLDALRDRMGSIRAVRTVAHLTKQATPTAFSTTAYQPYWTGIAEVQRTAGKFTMVPVRDENTRLALRPGEHHFSEDWKMRQRTGPLDFSLYWIPYLDEQRTPSRELTAAWEESHRELVGTVRFPQLDPDSDAARLWAMLAMEMGANHGHWVHDRENSIKEPATEFGVARKIAYQRSQDGRGSLAPETYRSVFTAGTIGSDLAQELRRRHEDKIKAGHVSSAST